MPHPLLRQGSLDQAAIRTLQELLNQHGNTLVVDGDFGVRTHEAVVRFQTANGLAADGVVTSVAWSALEGLGQSRPAAVTATQLKLRDAPRTGRVLRILTRGARVTVLAQHNAWYRVQSDTQQGYVHYASAGGAPPIVTVSRSSRKGRPVRCGGRTMKPWTILVWLASVGRTHVRIPAAAPAPAPPWRQRLK
jgi:peptidoglycan hydrolase-like protein with peptidoglycan-binding domain